MAVLAANAAAPERIMTRAMACGASEGLASRAAIGGLSPSGLVLGGGVATL